MTKPGRKTVIILFILMTIIMLHGFVMAGDAKKSKVIFTSEEKKWLADHIGEITLSFDPNFPPLEYTDENGNFAGFTSDLLLLVESKLNFKFVRKAYKSWHNVMSDAKSGRLDVIMQIAQTPLRNQYLNFTRPYITVPNVILTKDDYPYNVTLSKLKGKRVGVVSGYAAHEMIGIDYPGINLIPVEDEKLGLMKLSINELDAMVMFVSSASFFINQMGLTNLSISEIKEYNFRFSMASRKSMPELNVILQKALDDIPQEDIDRIYGKWVKIKTPSFYESRKFKLTILIIVLGVSVVIALILIWNHTLQRQVAEITREVMKAKNDLVAVYNTIRSALIIVSQDGRIKNMNAAAFGILENNSNDKYDGYFWNGIPALAVHKEQFFEVLKTGKAFEFSRMELNIHRKMIVNVYYQPILFEDDSGVIIRIDDITEMEKNETLLREAQKMEVVGTLAGGIAHDFNNILGGIIGFTSIIQMKLDSGENISEETIKEYITLLDESGHRAADMVQQLLFLSRKQDLETIPFDLNTSVKYVSKICSNSFDKSIMVKTELFQQSAMVNGDPGQIEQALLNICINASHAMTIMRGEGEVPGGVLVITIERSMLETTTSGIMAGDYWVISVSDSGVGMSKDQVSRIFDPFFTTKKKGEGTGLGLTMVYNIINRHGGSINIYSEPGTGTTFRLYLPVFKDIEGLGEKISKKEVPRGSGLILIVDDETTIRDVASSILRESGYDIILAENGTQALEIFGRMHSEIAAVLLDISMSDKSGLEVFHEMKIIDPDVRVMISSGLRMDERMERALSHGVKRFIHKPYTFRKLAEEMSELLKET